MELKKSMSQKLRMDGRDYSRPGWYFVTLGADYHNHLFDDEFKEATRASCERANHWVDQFCEAPVTIG